MRKRLFIILLVLVLSLPLTGCGCDHEWYAASCSAPKTCSLCGATEGEALPHTWQEATCTTPKTCSVCKATEGSVAAHKWQEATCTTPKTCSVCKKVEGKVAAHKWQEATTEAPKTCSVCKIMEGSHLKTDSRFTTASTKHLHGAWFCDAVITDEMMGLQNFGNVNVRLTLTFGNTGKVNQEVTLKDKDDFMTKLKKYTADTLYETFAQQGLSKEQANQAMLDAYGLNVNDYVDASLKGYDANAVFKAYIFERVYYVENGAVYTALSWDAKFDKDEYSLKDGQLKIDGLSLEEGSAPLIWTRK